MKDKVTIEVKLKEFEFQCKKCKKIHIQSVYCRVQVGMGHVIDFTCDCGEIEEFYP